MFLSFISRCCRFNGVESRAYRRSALPLISAERRYALKDKVICFIDGLF